jgi:hypothetical protein
MKKVLVLLMFLFLFSCQYFEKKVPNENELLQKRLDEINWDEVDQYPTVSFCDSVTDAIQKKKCFFDYLTTTINLKFVEDKLYVKFPKIDTLNINVTIFPDAKLEFKSILKDTLAFDKIKMDSILQSNLKYFPMINPALKRGIPVKTNFTLPVKLKPN